MKITIERPGGQTSGAENHAFISGIVFGMLSLLPNQLPELIVSCEPDVDELTHDYLGTTTITHQNGNRYRVHIEPYRENVN